MRTGESTAQFVQYGAAAMSVGRPQQKCCPSSLPLHSALSLAQSWARSVEDLVRSTAEVPNIISDGDGIVGGFSQVPAMLLLNWVGIRLLLSSPPLTGG